MLKITYAASLYHVNLAAICQVDNAIFVPEAPILSEIIILFNELQPVDAPSP
jgi:hypothetical protein